MADYLACDQLLVPFGIHHPDHTLTTNMAISLLYNHTDVPDTVLFYEDIPYRVDYPELANIRFTHIENIMGRMRMLEDQPIGSRKREAVESYRSQTGGNVIDRVMVRERIWQLVR